MRPPAVIAGISVRKYVLDLLREDIARCDRLVRAANANLSTSIAGSPARRTRLALVTRLRNDAQRAREARAFFRAKFHADER